MGEKFFLVKNGRESKKVKKSEKVRSKLERENSETSFAHVYTSITFSPISTVIGGNKQKNVFT